MIPHCNTAAEPCTKCNPDLAQDTPGCEDVETHSAAAASDCAETQPCEDEAAAPMRPPIPGSAIIGDNESVDFGDDDDSPATEASLEWVLHAPPRSTWSADPGARSLPRSRSRKQAPQQQGEEPPKGA